MTTISSIDERTIDLACFIIENRTTIRIAASQFGIGKSTAHENLTKRLPELNPHLYKEVRVIMDQNFSERQIRGGRSRQRLLRQAKTV